MMREAAGRLSAATARIPALSAVLDHR